MGLRPRSIGVEQRPDVSRVCELPRRKRAAVPFIGWVFVLSRVVFVLARVGTFERGAFFVVASRQAAAACSTRPGR